MGEVIQAAHLFQREPAPTDDPDVWEWGREFVDNGINNLDAIIDDVKNARSEDALLRAMQELKTEVNSYPIPD